MSLLDEELVEEKEHADCYTVGKTAIEEQHYKVFRAVENSIDAPCFYHRIEMVGETSQQQCDAAIAVLKRFATLTHPHAPRLADAWFDTDHMVAVEYRANTQPLDLAGNNPLAGQGSIGRAEVFMTTLDLVRALHSSEIVHGHIRPETFGLKDGRRIYLEDSGLDPALVKCFHAGEMDFVFELSTNLYARDVGCWAFAILSLLRGQPLIEESLEEKWDEYAMKNARKQVESLIAKEPLREFMMQCLGGLGADAPHFENAIEAMEHWDKYRLRGAVA